MKALLILFGESFRLGGYGNRNRGSNESYIEQINAAKSHILFLEELKKKECSTDVYISSYNTKFDKDLEYVYNNFLLKSDFYENLIGANKLIHNAIDNITNIEQYNFVLFMRIDLYLKNEFINIFDINWDKILFPCICYKPHHKCGIHPRNNDMMIYIPKKYYNYIKNIDYARDSHGMWNRFINETDLKYDDLDTMINTFHDSDSEKDFNPLYYIVNRKKTDIFHSEGHIFDKMNFN